MKKIISSIILALAAQNINAQLVVDSLGRVGIGTEIPKALLSVGNNNDSLAAISCRTSYTNNKKYGTYISNYNNVDDYLYGIYIKACSNNNGICYGQSATAISTSNTNTSQYVIGVGGYAGRSHTAVGLMGGGIISTIPCVNFAGVYGSESNSRPTFSTASANYSGTYAGYFRGTVRVTNGIYATLLSPSAVASPSGQSGIPILSGRGESVTDKLCQVQALQFLRYDPTKETATKTTSTSLSEDIDIENMTPEEIEALSDNTDEEPEPYLSPVQYGLAADQLKAVYPELVYEDANGNVSINYVEMIPLLVQSINELSQKVAELEGTSRKKAKAQPTAIEESVSDVDMVRMDQNKPNPFSKSTVIGLNIPEKTQTAKIFIYDLSGKQIQNIPVAERGETNITVYAADLSAGMYIYTLVVDGKVVVTRRMIVEE